MLRKLGLAVLVFALGSVAALAADFNGKWTAQVEGRNGMQTLTFDFHVDGTALTGKITTPRGDTDITDGKVDGDTVSFAVVREFNGNSTTSQYSGKISADKITGKIEFSRNGETQSRDWTANRSTETK